MADLLRVSILGAFPGGEEWSVNPVYGLADFGTPVTPTQAQTVATAIAAVSVGAAGLVNWNTTTTLVGCRVEARDRDGVLETQAEALKTLPQTGSSSVVHTFQTSLVTSLRSAQVGPSGRGRLYWPATGLTLSSSNLRPSTAAVTNSLAAFKTYLSDIQTAIRITLPGAYLAVWSRKQVGLFGVNRIMQGDVVDVQRRRRDTLIENYQTVTYP